MAAGAETTKGGGWKGPLISALKRLNLGGLAGGVTAQTQITKAVTAFTDTSAKAVFTVTVPNTTHSALVEVDALGIIGAGGGVDFGTVRSVKYAVAVVRTAGVAAVAGVSAAVGGATAAVAGSDALTSVVVTCSAMTGANTATQTFTILVAITKTAGGSDNHKLTATARLLNSNASGITIA